jgi:oxygen-independent coproporphyrinogen-3 oxidase
VVRGYALDADDLLRRDVIMALMCQGRLDFASVERNHGIRIADAFASELAALGDLARAGLLQLDPQGVRVTAAGWFLIRAIAMVFDRHLRASQEHTRFSRVV